MALEVEDGTGKVNADSYGTTADAVTYITDYYPGDPFLALDPAIQDSFMRQGAASLDGAYEFGLSGHRTSDAQALAWPRNSARDFYANVNVDSDVVPASITRSQFETVRRLAAGTDILADLGRETRREKVDVIEVEYANSAAADPTFQLIDSQMGRYMDGGPGEFRMTRG